MKIKYFLILITLIFVIFKYFIAESVEINKLVKVLERDTNQQVYVGDKLSNSSNEIIQSLLNINESIADYSNQNPFNPIYISIRGDNTYLKFALYKSSLSKGYVNDEYWTYLFDIEKKKYFYIGQIHIDIFLNEKDRLKIKKQKERLRDLKIIRDEKLQDWKVPVIIGFMLLLVFILVYDGLFRQNHFKLKTKNKYWILFQMLFAFFLIFMAKSFLEGETFYMLVFMIVLATIRNIVTLSFCEECSKLGTKRNLFSKKFICSVCLDKNSRIEKDEIKNT